jgi:uncharacterized MAPEG superfamily protein
MRFETQLDTLVFAILIAGLMPMICAVIAKWGAQGYDNHNPRVWLEHQEGFRARANAAQQNCLEAFPFFAVGVMLASLGGADGDLLEMVGWFFVVMRAAYIACYVTDKATLRSVVWALGYAAVIYLYVLALY